jgi:hypothetical protein
MGPGGEPDSVMLAGENAKSEDVDVEALEAGEVAGLERELGEAVGGWATPFPSGSPRGGDVAKAIGKEWDDRSPAVGGAAGDERLPQDERR